jgi:hypothetical protein
MKKLILFTLLMSFNLQAATVLVMGDSHTVGPFGASFDQFLRDGGHQVATYGSCGSVAKWWTNGQKTACGFFSRDLKGSTTRLNSAATPLVSKLLSDIRPDVVAIEFGGNYRNLTAEFTKQDLRNLIATVKASGAKCFFITNPDTRNYRSEIPRLSATLKEAVGDSCPIFESYLVTKYPATGGDGVHYSTVQGTPIAKEWAKKAFDAFSTHWK